MIAFPWEHMRAYTAWVVAFINVQVVLWYRFHLQRKDCIQWFVRLNPARVVGGSFSYICSKLTKKQS
jgi:hypothetical protein